MGDRLAAEAEKYIKTGKPTFVRADQWTGDIQRDFGIVRFLGYSRSFFSSFSGRPLTPEEVRVTVQIEMDGFPAQKPTRCTIEDLKNSPLEVTSE